MEPPTPDPDRTPPTPRTPPPPPPPPADMARGLSLGPPPAPVAAPSTTPAILVVLGAAAVIGGVFLPWVTATVPGRTVSETGFQIGNYGTLILGGFALARGLSMLRPGTFRMQLGTPVIGGVLILAFVALRWGALTDIVTQARSVGADASIGIGVWTVVAGAATVIAGGLLAGRMRRLA